MSRPFAGIRHALRSVRRAPAFSALAIAILGSGIGATTAMYALVRAVVTRELPFEDPHRLVWMYNQRTERDRAPFSVPDLEDYRRQASTLTGVAAFTNWTTNVTGDGPPERLDGVRVSGNFFDLLGTRAALGRGLQQRDEVEHARVAVLTHGLWVHRFAGDAGVIGRTVVLNGATYTVVGVLPPRFLFPFREAEVAVPLALHSDPRRADRGANFVRAIARLAPGVTFDHAKVDLDAIAHQLQRQYPDEDARKTGVSIYPLHGEIVRDYRAMLLTLFGSVGVLLLVACVNLANLLLVRSVTRRDEFSIRLSLGASRGRLARQLLGEVSMLAAMGGTAGLALAELGLGAWRLWGPADFPHMSELAVDRHVVFFSATVSAGTAAICGVAPAWVAARVGSLRLRGASRPATASRVQRAIQRFFVTTEVAAAVVLVGGMLLMTRGLARLQEVAPGFTPDSALLMQLSLPPATYNSRAALVRFFESANDRLHAIAAIESAGVVSLPPLSGLLATADVAFPGRPSPPPDEVPQAHLRVATAEYFDAAGIRLLDGRRFDNRDRQIGEPVAIVSRTFAERHWTGTTAIGQRVQLVQSPPAPDMDIVGIVSDVKQFTLDGPPSADLYVPLHQMPAFQVPLLASRMYWVVRGRDEIPSLTESLRAVFVQVDPVVAASTPRTLQSVWRAATASQRTTVRLLQLFGGVALALSGIGVYAVAALAARTRRRELAIRAALGASRRTLTLSLLRLELKPVAAGLLLGLVVALTVAPVVFDGLFGVSPREGAPYGQLVVAVFSVTLVAAGLPLWRAAAVNLADLGAAD